MKINHNLRTSLLNHVISRQYRRDLNGTPEIDTVVKEQIYLPVLEYAIRAREYGVDDRFLFANRFVARDTRKLYDRTSLSDVQAQGYLNGDAVQSEQAPQKVYRVVPATKETRFRTLTIPTSGAVFTFHANHLSRSDIVCALQSDREAFLRSLGMNPSDLPQNVRLVEIDNKDHRLTLFKPTNKDGNFRSFFRYNSSGAPWGQTLNLNSGESSTGFQEFVMKDFDLHSDPLRIQVAWEDI